MIFAPALLARCTALPLSLISRPPCPGCANVKTHRRPRSIARRRELRAFLRAPRSFAHRISTLNPIDELCLRIAEQPVDDRHRGQHLEDTKSLRANLHRNVSELSDRNDRYQGRILEEGHPCARQDRQYPPQR